MPLDVPSIGQPHRFGCLPTCVQAVRRFYGERLNYDEASELCDEISPDGGCLWDQTVAALGVYYETEELTPGDEDDATTMLTKLTHRVRDTPVICHIGMDFDRSAKHAVVVIAVTDEGVELMNPAPPGGRREIMPRDEFLARWQQLDFGAFYFLD